MNISAAQCRAARALLDWSQDDLARNAQVARATVADFERNIRLDLMRQNLVSIVSTLEAAGVEFIAETVEGAGAGVRLRKLELEYSRNVKLHDMGLSIPVRYRGREYRAFIPPGVLDDIDQVTGRTSNSERVLSLQNHLPIFLRAVEEKLIRGEDGDDGRIVINARDLPAGALD